MDTTRLCPQCQQPLSADAPDGLCPQCLMKAAAGPPPSGAGEGLAGDFIDIGDPAEVTRKLPQFEILEMLGRGGMGVVYKARQRNLDRVVALKILPPLDALSPDFVARFSREARALAKLNHPNIVNVHDFGEAGGLYYIVMEYVDGANLRQVLQTRRLAPAEALAIVPKICDALEYAHEEGLVHRDIKPENLLIDKKGRVKIADFGLAKLLRREPLDMTLTLSGMALGTLRYMAPEQMDKPETVDHRADLYSLGVVIYEMLTGETPVGRFELPSQKAQVDARLDEIVLHALEKEPDRRYQHASEVRDDVEKVTSKPQVAPMPKSDASTAVAGAGGIPFIQAAGEVFAMRFMPRDLTDWTLGLVVGLIPASLFLALPALGIYLLCVTAGVDAVHSTSLSLVAGAVLTLTLIFILASGSVHSVSVDLGGITLNRMIGPSRFLPWSSIVQIQAMSRWDAAKTVIWPGFSPRASIFSGAFTHFYRIACVDDCWHFGPKEPEKFLEAVRRLRNAAGVSPGLERQTDAPKAAAAVASPASPAVTAPVREVEAQPVTLHPLPRFFHLRFFVLLLLGWGAVAALWNFGPAGVLAGATIMGAIVLEAARSYALRYPPWVEMLRARRFITRWLLLFFNLFALMLLFAAIIGGLFLLWDANAAEGPGSRITPKEFEAKYKGKEYQLIRNLTAFKEQVPAVELVTDVTGFTGTSSEQLWAVPLAWVCIGCGVLAILFLFQQAAGEQRSLWLLNPGRWRPAFASTGIVVASLLCASVALHWITRRGSDGHILTHPSGATDTTVEAGKANIEQTSLALRDWAAENGFTSTQHRWSVQTVPKGETVASVQIFEAWKNSPFDRWRMTRSGLVRSFPLLSGQLLTTEKPFENRITVDCGNSWVDADSAKEKQWNAILTSAIDAMRKKAPGIDPKKYTPPPPIAKGTAESTSWTGFCAVLAAAMLWSFLRIRFGNLASGAT